MVEPATGLMALTAIDTDRLTDWDMLLRLALQVVLFAGSAFFSMSETALFSLSRIDLQNLRRARHPQTDNLHALLDQPRQLIVSILCGNELINIAASVNLAGILLDLYGRPDLAALANIVLMFPLLMLFGEVTPKTVAVTQPVSIATGIVAKPMSIWVRTIRPVRHAVRAVADRITTALVGEAREEDHLLKVDEFRSLLEDVAAEGYVSATERTIIDNLIEADQTEIVQIMVPRPRIRFINADRPVADIVGRFRKHRYARVPVYRKHRDRVLGMLHAEDVLRLVVEGTDLATVRLEDLLRPALFVPPTKRVDEMFELFRTHDTNAALVLNEFGGVDGLVSLHDVTTFVFGELAEADLHAPKYIEEDDGSFVVSASMRLDVFNKLTNLEVSDSRMTTIGGVVFRLLDRVPETGDEVQIGDAWAKVLKMSGFRISKLSIQRGRPPTQPPAIGSLDVLDDPMPDRPDDLPEQAPEEEEELETDEALVQEDQEPETNEPALDPHRQSPAPDGRGAA